MTFILDIFDGVILHHGYKNTRTSILDIFRGVILHQSIIHTIATISCRINKNQKLYSKYKSNKKVINRRKPIDPLSNANRDANFSMIYLFP